MRGIARFALIAMVMPCAAQTQAEELIAAGHWKQARALVDARQTHDARTQFLLSQIHAAFDDRESPLPLAEKAVALDGRVARYHRQVAEVTGVMAQHAGLLQQILLARRFRHEIDIALALDPRDVQALRDSMEFYLLAPGIAGGDKDKGRAVAARIARVDAVEGHLAQARLAEVAGDRSRQENALRNAVEAGPSNYRARIALAQFLLSRADWDGARQQAEIAMDIDSTRVDTYSVLATAYASQSMTNELEAVLTMAEKRVPDDLSPYFRAGEVLSATGHDLDRAQRYLHRYLAVEPEGKWAYVGRDAGETGGSCGENPGAQCDSRNARTTLRTGQMARTASRLIEVMALSQVYWVTFRILGAMGHLQFFNLMLRPICYSRMKIWRRISLAKCRRIRLPGVAIEQHESNLPYRSIFTLQVAFHFADRDGGSVRQRITVHTGTDRRKTDGSHSALFRHREALPVTGSQQFRFAAAAIAVDGADGVKHEFRRQTPRAGGHCFAGGTPALGLADAIQFPHDLLAAGAMDRPIHAASAGQCRVGRVDNRVHRQPGDVALVKDNLASACAHPFHTSITIVL